MFKKLTELDEAWRTRAAGARLDAVRTAAPRLKARVQSSGKAKSVRTYDLVTLGYPTRYGLGDAARSILPYVMITNRMQLVSVKTDDGERRLLVNPSDHVRDEATPFFHRLTERYGKFLAHKVMSKRHAEVPDRLAEAGVPGSEIDFVTFDHLHTQDLRRVLLEWCPKAQLLVQRDELAALEKLHPLQSDWYIAESLAGVPRERVTILDGDFLVGEGVALIHTPGHTIGNHSLVLHTDRGIWTVSENGIAADNYRPEASEIGGLREHARSRGVEVILNSNTREHSLDQYTSMILEKSLADLCPDGSGWPQHFPSSELTASALTPGLAATYSQREITHGPPPR